MAFFRRVREEVAADHTIQRIKYDGTRVARATPSASVNYLLDKVPIVQWLPKYNPRWILYDCLAGLTVGVLLIPQSLAYAKIATIPVEFGLMSSWLPNFVYFIMGTSKEVDMSTGPTSLMGLLTAEIIRDVSQEGFTPQAISSAVAMSVGVYCLIVGLFKLGFVLEFISVPVLNGFVSAAAIVIMLGQVPSLFGISAGTGTANIIHDIFAQAPKWKPATMAIGFGGIMLLVMLQKIGQKWGQKSKIIWLLALARSAVVLILFTGISYGLNRNVKTPVFEISKVKSNGIATPKMPALDLFQKVFARAVAPFLAASLEHLAIAKGFGRKNNYAVDQSQELVYLGVTNFFNSFFSSMSVGGAMSRTAVNSDTGVKSPAFGLFAGGFVLLAIFKLSPALFWIPKATLAAIIVTAVWHVIMPPRVFYSYWKTSLADFVASMLSFWVTLFVSTEMGIASAVGFNVFIHILSSAFARVRQVAEVGEDSTGNKFHGAAGVRGVPLDSQVFKFNQSVIFWNAFCVKDQCFDVVQTFNSGSVIAYEAQKVNRNWSVSGERRIKQMRAKAGVLDDPVPIQVVVLDMSMVTTIDTTGLVALSDFKADLKKYGGEGAELRIFGMTEDVQARFERFGWDLYPSESISLEHRGKSKGTPLYHSMLDAVNDRRIMVAADEVGPDEFKIVGSEKA
ncbi:sulfate permease [Lindgomyces ingoldianus]|uniref:Sulfate permease n=1 Tax=Lindgomyces ingoldianus TaxID=673940 RepID=A0ACB6Q7J1_9PLEO|nr:sulfate permease [Lindgomyces ingoldianus]KAF2462791.1 sulfate permease [Lindgomyces ingoldianus]